MNFKKEDLLASVCRESFYDFVLEFWGTIIAEKLQMNWHIKYLCGQLQEVAERVFKGLPRLNDLVINVPPGTSKSSLCSQMFPAWVWTRMPGAKFICVSYAHQVALKDSLKTRDILQSELYKRCFPDIELRADENMKELFSNTQKGFRLSAGIGGAVTGYHGHFLIIDDPINPEEAHSEIELRSVNRWMETTIPSRKVDKEVTVTILIQQRLHQSDPTGEMLEKSKGVGVRHICLPGELTEDVAPKELAAFYKDGLLDPVRLSRETLETMRRDLGDYGYASQVCQMPVPPGGGMFKVNELRIVDEPEVKMVRKARSWDKAASTDAGAYSVGVLMGVDVNGNYWVLDIVRGRWSPTKREMKIKFTAEMDGVEIPILLELEGGSGGKESGESTIRNLAGYRVIAQHPTGDKETRAYPFSSQVGGGNVYVLKRGWTRDYTEELRFFPRGKYKDQIDSSSQAFNFLSKKRIRIGGWRA
jgi:predicted phage terminase large subunit-like protein